MHEFMPESKMLTLSSYMDENSGAASIGQDSLVYLNTLTGTTSWCSVTHRPSQYKELRQEGLEEQMKVN
jgi:hypothetical protein